MARGERYLSPCAVRSMEKRQASEKHPVDSLSERKKQIFLLMGKGFGNTEIAKQLQLSRGAVETYCTRMAQKMDFPSRSELRNYAIYITKKNDAHLGAFLKIRDKLP